MSRSSTEIPDKTPPEPNIYTRLTQPAYKRIVQNFRLVWLDASIDEENDNDWCENIRRLRRSISIIDTFADPDQCIQFLENIKEEITFMVVTGYVGQHVISIIHNMAQIESIYILCGNRSKHEQWAKQWQKIRGLFTDIPSVCDALKKAALQCDQNYISIGFMPKNDDPSTQNLDQLDQSFMYTQILKDILLTIDFDESHIKEFTNYCREHLPNDPVQISMINELEGKYHEYSPIWWYTSESFLYPMLNRALRQMEIDIIIKVGFFISDLHHQIEQLHIEQYGDNEQFETFVVYRGQGLPPTDFDRIQKTDRRINFIQ